MSQESGHGLAEFSAQGLIGLRSGSSQAAFSSEVCGVPQSSRGCSHNLVAPGSVSEDLLSFRSIRRQFTRWQFASSRTAGVCFLHTKHNKDTKYCNLLTAATSPSPLLCSPDWKQALGPTHKQGEGLTLDTRGWAVHGALSEFPLSQPSPFSPLTDSVLKRYFFPCTERFIFKLDFLPETSLPFLFTFSFYTLTPSN